MKILLAEDDLITSEIVKEQLEQWNYSVYCAYKGTDAWEILQQDDGPKLAILDWQMPGVTGLEICKRLRSRTSGSYVYVIMLTSLSDKANVVQGLEAGADDYLTKPCNPHELKVRLMAGQRILSLENELLATLGHVKESMFKDTSTIYETRLIGREIEILRLIAAGKTNEEIALAFQLSPDWVNAHLTNIITKMGVNTRQEAVDKALRDGYLQPSATVL